MRALLVLSFLLAAGAAQAASFDCKRAATPIERTICADAALSQLDERTVAAYGEAVETLGISEDINDPAGDLLLKGH